MYEILRVESGSFLFTHTVQCVFRRGSREARQGNKHPFPFHNNTKTNDSIPNVFSKYYVATLFLIYYAAKRPKTVQEYNDYYNYNNNNNNFSSYFHSHMFTKK